MNRNQPVVNRPNDVTFSLYAFFNMNTLSFNKNNGNREIFIFVQNRYFFELFFFLDDEGDEEDVVATFYTFFYRSQLYTSVSFRSPVNRWNSIISAYMQHIFFKLLQLLFYSHTITSYQTK